jgi:hypothetical protein
VHFIQNLACIVEPEEERTRAALFLRREQTMLARNVSRVLCQPVGTKHLAPDWADEAPFRGIAAAEQVAKSGRGVTGRNYCRHESLNVSLMSRRC